MHVLWCEVRDASVCLSLLFVPRSTAEHARTRARAHVRIRTRTRVGSRIHMELTLSGMRKCQKRPVCLAKEAY